MTLEFFVNQTHTGKGQKLVFTTKALEVGLIFATFFIIPAVFSAPAAQTVDKIETRLQNPCGYRQKHIRHSRSPKAGYLETQFKVFKNDYRNKWEPAIEALYGDNTNLSLEFPISLPKKAFKNKKRNYENLQFYVKVFDSVAKQNLIATLSKVSLEKRKALFDALTASSIGLLCVMYDEQKKHPKLKKNTKDLDKKLSVPQDFTQLYTQDHVLLSDFDDFLIELNKVIPYRKKQNKKNNQTGKNGNQKQMTKAGKKLVALRPKKAMAKNKESPKVAS